MPNTDNTYLGTTTSGGIRVWNPKHIEYMIGALLAVTLKLSNTTRNLPNLPTGDSIAPTSPPTFPSVKPVFQAGIECADNAAAAPRHSRVICRWLEAS